MTREIYVRVERFLLVNQINDQVINKGYNRYPSMML
jgi:hypothetical protein